MPQPNEIRNLEDLYQAYAGPVYGYLLRLSGDPALADDLTAETFFQALLGLVTQVKEAVIEHYGVSLP